MALRYAARMAGHGASARDAERSAGGALVHVRGAARGTRPARRCTALGPPRRPARAPSASPAAARRRRRWRCRGSAAVIGPIVEPHGQVAAVGVALVRDAGLLAGEHERGGAGAVGGVAQVAVHLQHRPAVELDAVAGLVAVGVVRVGGVGHVRGRAQRPGQGPEEVLPRAAEARRDALEHRRQQVRGGAALRGGADLLVVEQHEHRDLPAGTPSAATARRARSPAHGEHRLSSRGALISSSSTPARVPGVRSWAMRSHAEDVARVARPSWPATKAVNPPGVGSPRPQIGLRCCCGFSWSPRSPMSPVEVDGQLRHAEERTVDPEEPLGRAGAVRARPRARTARGRGRARS